MNPDAPRLPLRPRTRNLLILLLILEVLGLGGYLWQRWWAKEVASRFVDAYGPYLPTWNRYACPEPAFEDVIWRWRRCPWYGESMTVPYGQGTHYTWIPRAAYREYAERITGEDPGNTLDAWESWFRRHPNLVWDKERKRLVHPRGERP